MSPEAFTVVVSGAVAAALVVALLRRPSDQSIAGAGAKLRAALDEGRLFAWVVLLLGIVFLTLQVVYALRMPLADDEFSGALAAHRVTEMVPYRDYAPYKTVVGYYVQALPLLLTDDLWAGILLIRVEMAVINALVLTFVAFRLRRHFRGSAVCPGLALLVVMSTFVERSWVLRVDMLGSLCGLLSLLFLLERRPAWAGAIAGLGFTVSQKNVYFILAGGAALGAWWLSSLWRRRPGVAASPRDAFLAALRFGLATLAVLAAYFGFWSAVGSFDRAVVSVAETSADYGLSDRPFVCPREFWWQTLRRNPGFYGAAAIALATLASAARHRPRRRDGLLLVYGAAMVALSVWHKQPCPYFFVILIPTLFVLVVDLFDRLARGAVRLPARAGAAILLLYLGLGLAVPLSRLPRTLQRDNGFQRHTVVLADALLQPGDGYLASLPILYDREQAVPELAWLDDITRRRLHRTSPEELLEIARRIDSARLKVVIMNYRLDDLPQILRDYFVYHYAHFWGSVFLYAPFVGTGARPFHVEFEGLYRIDVDGSGEPVVIDGRTHAPGEGVRLAQGTHVKSSPGSVRLRYIPEYLDRSLLDPAHRDLKDMFAFSFHY